MRILGIETSCDETAAAVIETDKNSDRVRLISNIISSSLPLHSKTGGIIPEVAAREQIKYIIPVIEKAIKNIPLTQIDKIAVTIGPGLIGSLLVGVETAKTLSFVLNKPLIPVNHLFGHIYANWVGLKEEINFPAIALVVSGGHTDLVLMESHGKIKWLGGTRDDAAGEAFDKIGRLLNLSYPAGSLIEKLAKDGNPNAYNLPRPMIDSNDFDFSFSGLKTAILREVNTIKKLDNKKISDLCASSQQAILEVLIKKTLFAVKRFNPKSLLLGGGVAANQRLRDTLAISLINNNLSLKLLIPEKILCTDNAAMIATAAYFNSADLPWKKVNANPELYFD